MANRLLPTQTSSGKGDKMRMAIGSGGIAVIALYFFLVLGEQRGWPGFKWVDDFWGMHILLFAIASLLLSVWVCWKIPKSRTKETVVLLVAAAFYMFLI